VGGTVGTAAQVWGIFAGRIVIEEFAIAHAAWVVVVVAIEMKSGELEVAIEVAIEVVWPVAGEK
jgi:hypothetical protein